jgi:phosphatidylglycerol lysyltransferase
VGAALVFGFFAFARLIGYAPHRATKPTDGDIETVGRIIASQTSTLPHLVYLRDKAILFDERRGAFVMYGIQGRTWVALGDPVGPADRMPELIRSFLGLGYAMRVPLVRSRYGAALRV